MKKKLALSICSFILALAVSAQKVDASKVPAPAKDYFTKQYPGTTPKWELEKGNYEASFKHGKTDMSVLFSRVGTVLATERDIPVADLPAAVKDYIKSHYNGASIKDANKITLANGNVEYEAALKDRDIIFDANGNFLREEQDDVEDDD